MSDCQNVKLGDVLSVKSGFAFKSAEFSKSGIPIIRISNISTSGSVTTSDSVFYKEDPKLSRFIVEYGDILIAMSGATTGKIGIYKEKKPAYLNQRVGKIDVNRSKADLLYIYHLFNTKDFAERIGIGSIGGAQPNISGKDIEQMAFAMPPIEKQREIAACLSTWDRAIELHDRLIALKEKQKQGLMQQLLTGKKRLLDDNGVPFSGEWVKSNLDSVAEIKMGSSPKSTNYNESGIGLPLIQGNADIVRRLSNPRVFTSEITKECFPGEILLSVRAPVGTVALSVHHACVGRGISAICAKDGVSQAFLYQFLLLQEPQWASISQGSTFESVNSKEIKSLTVNLPDFAEQIKISKVLSSADTEIDAIKRKRDLLKHQKQGLMQQLLG